MVMMPPSIMMASASTPAIMVTSATVMTPTMTVAVATFHLDDGSIGASQHIRMYGWQCRRRQGRSKRKSAGRKAYQRKPLHDVCPPGSAWARSSVMRQSVRLFHGRSNTTRLESDAGVCRATITTAVGSFEYVQTARAIRLNLDKLPRLYRNPLESDDD
jgi:hypothetical protein